MMNILGKSLRLLALFIPLGLHAQQPAGSRYLNKQLPQTWGQVVADPTFQQTLPVDDNWWKLFQDPLLDSLIQVAIDQNYTLELAAYRVEVAQTNFRAAKGAYYPTLGLNAGWNKEQSSGNTTSLPQSREHFISGTLASSWEIDVFGGYATV